MLLLTALIFSSRVEAQELWQAGVTPYAMGGAYSAAADDGLSLYYNPAGLAQVKRADLQLFDLNIGTNSNVVNDTSTLKKISNTGDLANELNSLSGQHVEAQGANFTQLTLPNFAFGVSYQVNANFDLQNTAYPTTQMQYTKDLGISAGYATAFGAKKEFRVGYRLAYMRREGGIEDVGINQITGSKQSLVDLFNQSGTGWGNTLGMQYQIPTEGRTEVTTSFVWHDIGDTSFGGYSDLNRPTRIDSDMVAGLAVRMPIGGRQNRRLERRYGVQRSASSLTFAFDYDNLNKGLSSEPFLLHSHLGMNLDLPILSLQLGMYQSSLTFGTGFDLGIFKISAATYGEDLGSFAGQDRDRRYLLSIGSDFGFKKF